jgi:hypothetical protein
VSGNLKKIRARRILNLKILEEGKAVPTSEVREVACSRPGTPKLREYHSHYCLPSSVMRTDGSEDHTSELVNTH